MMESLDFTEGIVRSSSEESNDDHIIAEMPRNISKEPDDLTFDNDPTMRTEESGSYLEEFPTTGEESDGFYGEEDLLVFDLPEIIKDVKREDLSASFQEKL